MSFVLPPVTNPLPTVAAQLQTEFNALTAALPSDDPVQQNYTNTALYTLVNLWIQPGESQTDYAFRLASDIAAVESNFSGTWLAQLASAYTTDTTFTVNGFVGSSGTSGNSSTTSDPTVERISHKGAANGYAPLDSSSLVPLANLPTIPFSKTSGVQASLGFTPENTANKNAPNGYAPLDSGSKLPTANLPNIPLANLPVIDNAHLPIVSVPNGGTGVATLAAHGILVGEGTGSVISVTGANAGAPMLSGGASADPAYGPLNLAGGANIVTGTLPLTNFPVVDTAHGGTGANRIFTFMRNQGMAAELLAQGHALNGRGEMGLDATNTNSWPFFWSWGDNLNNSGQQLDTNNSHTYSGATALHVAYPGTSGVSFTNYARGVDSTKTYHIKTATFADVAQASGNTNTIWYTIFESSAATLSTGYVGNTGIVDAFTTKQDFFKGNAWPVSWSVNSITYTPTAGTKWASVAIYLGTANTANVWFEIVHFQLVEMTAPAPLTDNTTGTPGNTLVNVGTLFNQANINNNFATLNAELNSVVSAIKAAGISI
jgi:hypothetical protein